LPIKKIFAEDTSLEVSALEVYRSLLYTILAEYCIEAKLEHKTQKYLNTAVSYFKNNSYALALQARLKAEDDDIESGNMFKEALNSVEQYIDSIQQRDILARMNLGLDIYFRRTLYDTSDKYYSKALDLHHEPFLEATLLLNRGRNRLYKDDLAGAKRDLSKAEEEPLLSPYVHNNLGLLYYRAGLNEKAG
jgi:tetratricopeptide (TPR) repeat protein